jgi:hypothetical protein
MPRRFIPSPVHYLNQRFPGIYTPLELKRIKNPYNVVTLRGFAHPREFRNPPRILMLVQERQHTTSKRKQEIGTWRTSRHKIFKTPF